MIRRIRRGTPQPPTFEVEPIETERLLLRPLTLADLGPLHEVYGDRDVMRWIGTGDAYSRELAESEARLDRLVAHQEKHGFSIWAVTDRGSGMLLGDCGLVHWAHRGPEIELVYRLGKAYWGQGYATEAARAWVERGLDELGLERIVAATHPENVPSQHVLEKVGFRYERKTNYDGAVVRLYAIESGATE
jgi:ribosomal-protein-alanine N-acetyltransferase